MITYTIKFDWYDEDGNTPSENHQNYLEECALEKISEMRKEYYIGGKLSCGVD